MDSGYSASRGVRVLTAPTQGGMAGPSIPGWLQVLVLHRDGLPALRRLPILVLTETGVTQLR